VRLRGSIGGGEWRGSGNVTLTHGRVLGLGITEWNLPIEFSYAPDSGVGELHLDDTTLQIANGRGQGSARLHWTGSGMTGVSRMEGSLRFFDADLRVLLRPAGGVGELAVGRLTGRLEFSGNDVRSLDDVNATLDATLNRSQALELPVLRLLTPFVAPGRSALTFDRGDIHARLSRGVVRIQRLALYSPYVQMVVEGTVNLDGRLDLEATATTERFGVNPNALRLLGLRLPPVGPIPVSLALEVTAALSNQVIHLRITGTVRDPNVRIDPTRLLTDAAIRFFLGQAGVPVP
jgi:translocation and assembly module TamB